MDSQFDSGTYVARLRLILSSYLDDGEPLDSAAPRFADVLAEWHQDLSRLPSPTESFPAASVSTFYASEFLGDLRPNMAREDYGRIQQLLTAAVARMRGSI